MIVRDMPAPRTLGLLLTDGFALLSYASVIEPFRAANQLAGTELYRWVHVSPDGAPVRASSGTSIVADRAAGDRLPCDTLFVFAGGEPRAFTDAATFAWLRRLAQAGTVIAGVSGGPYLLAAAGLLEGHRATIHWEHRTEFAERFPDVALEDGLYVIDRRRLTCAGGTAGLDLALELIAREQGAALARKVGDWFIRSAAREADAPQRAGLAERHGVSDDRLVRVLAHMEAEVEEPASSAALARIAGLSVRQLERRFLARLGETIGSRYRSIRLDQADRLVRKTGMSMTEVALATGFRSAAHFSRAYAARFGTAPSRVRVGGTPPGRSS